MHCLCRSFDRPLTWMTSWALRSVDPTINRCLPPWLTDCRTLILIIFSILTWIMTLMAFLFSRGFLLHWHDTSRERVLKETTDVFLEAWWVPTEVYLCVCVSKSVPKTHNYIKQVGIPGGVKMFIQRRCIAWICAKLLFFSTYSRCRWKFQWYVKWMKGYLNSVGQLQKKSNPSKLHFTSWLNRETSTKIATTTHPVPLNCTFCIESLGMGFMNIFLFPLKAIEGSNATMSIRQWLPVTFRDPWLPTQPIPTSDQGVAWFGSRVVQKCLGMPRCAGNVGTVLTGWWWLVKVAIPSEMAEFQSRSAKIQGKQWWLMKSPESNGWFNGRGGVGMYVGMIFEGFHRQK